MNSRLLSFAKKLQITAIAAFLIMLIAAVNLFTAYAEDELTNEELSDVIEEETEIAPGSCEIAALEETVGAVTNIITDDESTAENEVEEKLKDDAADTVETEFENTAEENAIQLAINKALEEASEDNTITQVTILVEDGKYTGGLNISTYYEKTDETTGDVTNGQYTLAGDFLLNIIAHDAVDEATGSITNNSAGNVQVEGPIVIEGIDVLLAGLYLVTDSLIKAQETNIEIQGTAADDEINLQLSDGSYAYVDLGEGADNITLTGDEGITGEAGNITTDIYLGGGADTAEIDMSSGLNTAGISTVNVFGGEGADNVVLAGSLHEGGTNTAVKDPVTGEVNVTLDAQPALGETRTVNVNTYDAESHTDTLKNKTTIDLDGVYIINDVQSFINYNVLNYAGGDINVTLNGGSVPFLSNLSISGTEITVGNINASSLNLLIEAQKITVDGIINANNITLSASVTEGSGDEETEPTDTGTLDTTDQGDNTEDEESFSFDIDFNLFDFEQESYIIINEGAVLNAAESIIISCTTALSKGQLPKIPLSVDPNFANYKEGKATVLINGVLIAGKSVDIDAKTTIKVTVTNEFLAKYCVPLAINIALADTIIEIGGLAAITSLTGSISAMAYTAVTVSSKATTGALPISLALSVVITDTHVLVKDDAELFAPQGDINLAASCTMTVDTIAKTSEPKPNYINSEVPTGGTGSGDGSTTGSVTTPHTATSGGFFAISVIIQDVYAKIIGNASAYAQNISVESNAYNVINTKASSNNDATADAQNKEPGKLSKIMNTIPAFFDFIIGSGLSSISSSSKDKLQTASDSTQSGDDNDGVKDTFDTGTSGASDGTETSGTSTSQVVGALAVTVGLQSNAAVIDTTGSITALGDLTVRSVSDQKITTYADGSPLAQPELKEESKTNVEGGTITTTAAQGSITFKTGDSAPDITGAVKNEDGTYTVQQSTVILEGITIVIEGSTDKTVTIMNPTSVTVEGQPQIVTSEPIVFTGGTSTVTNGKLTITNVTALSILNGIITVTKAATGTYKYEGGTTVNVGGTMDMPNSNHVVTNANITNISSFKSEITDVMQQTALPSSTTISGITNSEGAAVTVTPVALIASGGGTEITNGTAKFTGANIIVTIIGGNRDGSNVISQANVEITGATLTVDAADVTITNGNVTGCTLDGKDVTITGAEVKIQNGKVTITGGTIKIYLTRITLTGTNGVAFDGGKFTYEGGATCAVTTPGSSTVTITKGKVIDGIQNGQNTSSSISIGVGIAIAIMKNENVAYVNAGTLSAQSLTINAETKNLSSKVEAISGFSGGDIGIAGSVAVNVVSAKTEALLLSDITMADDDGTIDIKATQSGSFSTSAKSVSEGTAKNLGIGCAIAIAITGSDVTAKIEDGVQILNSTGGDAVLKSVDLLSKYSGKEQIKSNAGAKGGKSIVPVLSLIVSGVAVESTFGAGNMVETKEDINISSTNILERILSADAAAAGGTVAVGASFVVDIVNDTTASKLLRSVKAQNVIVTSTAKSTVKATSKAGANGAASQSASTGDTSGDTTDGDEDTGEADRQADKNVSSASKLSNGANTKNVNSTSVDSLSANRQTAQTSEGNVSVAAALVLNIQNNSSTAQIADGLVIIASGKVEVISINKTVAQIKATGEATNAETGVGVGVAINIVTYSNIAYLGDSRVSADELYVLALVPTEASLLSTTANTLQAMLQKIVQEFVTDMLEKMAAEIGLEDLFQSTDIDTQIVKLVSDSVDAVCSAFASTLGLQDIYSSNLDTLIQDEMRKYGFDGYDSYEELFDAVKEYFMNEMADAFTNITETIEYVLEDISQAGSAQDLYNAVTGIGLDDETFDVIKTIVANIKTVVFSSQLMKEITGGTILETVKANITDLLKNLGGSATETAFNIVKAWLGYDAGNPYGHQIITEAIAGAGATDVGIAGAVALAIINGDTTAQIAGAPAYIWDTDSDIAVSGLVSVKAVTTHVIKTIASSAVGPGGGADANTAAADNANGDTEDAPTTSDDLVSDYDTTDDGTATPPDASDPVSPSTENTPTKEGTSIGVGAAFTLNLADINVTAQIGENRKIEAGAFELLSSSDSCVQTSSVSGSDPIEKLTTVTTDGDTTTSTTTKNDTTTKDISVDAAVAVSLIDTSVLSQVLAGTKIITSGTDIIDANYIEGSEAEILANVYIAALQKGKTLTTASGFTYGDKTAVGAAVAVNIADSDVRVSMLGDITAAGKAVLIARTYDQDDCRGIATAMGSEVDRYAQKLKKAKDPTAETTDGANTMDLTDDDMNDAIDGNYNGTDENAGSNANNNTATAINDKLDANSNSETDDSDPADTTNSSPLSTNALNALDTNTENQPSTQNAQDSITNNATDNNGDPVSAQPESEGGQQSKIRVAAAVAVNITNHSATTQVYGSVTASAIEALAVNQGNFNTMGTGAAVSLDNGGNAIGVGVAVSVNKNTAIVEMGNPYAADSSQGSTYIAAGDITVQATLTQNMDGAYRGRLGAQALAGAIAGKDSDFAISAAVAIIVSKAQTMARINQHTSMTGKNIKVEASDKSKLAVRAGAITVSKGSSVGAGVSFALIYSHNEVYAIILNDVTITGDSLDVSAQKLRVDFDDYETDFGISNLATVGADDQNDGIVNFTQSTNEDTGGTGFDVSISADTGDMLGFINLLNFLTSTNYYAEAISGAVMGGTSGKLTASGSFAMVFFFNQTKALIGENAVFNIANDIDINAEQDTTARIIGGAVAAGKSKVGVGLTVAAIANSDEIMVQIADAAEITSQAGSVDIHSQSLLDTTVITMTAAATSGGTVTIGGSINVVYSKNRVEVNIGNDVIIFALNDVSIETYNEAYLLLISVSAGLGTGGTAVGGTFAVIITDNTSKILIGDDVQITAAAGAVDINTASDETLISILGSASGSTGGNAIAGTVSVLVTNSETKAETGSNLLIVAGDDVTITAQGKVFMITICLAVTASSSNAVGASISVNVFDRYVGVNIGDNASITSTGGDIIIEALAEDWQLAITAAGAAAGSNAIAGSISVVVGQNTVECLIGKYANLWALGSIGVQSNLDSFIILPVMALAVGGNVSVGASISILILKNEIFSIIDGNSTLTALVQTASDGIGKPRNRDEKRKGIIVSATAKEDIYKISISGAGGGSGAVAGVVNTLVIKNVLRAQIKSWNNSAIDFATHDVTSGEDVEVEADDESHIVDVAGGVAVGGSAGVGATVVVVVFNRDLLASIGTNGTLSAAGDVNVFASSSDKMDLVAVAFAASNVAVAGDANIIIFKNITAATAGGVINAASLNITALSNVDLFNDGQGASGGGTVGVVAVIIVTYVYNQTTAGLSDYADVTTTGAVVISASATEDILFVAAGIAVSGAVSVPFSAGIVFLEAVTIAKTGQYSDITASAVDITASDNFKLLGIVGSVGAAGAVGVGISALVVIAHNTVEAKAGAYSSITTTSGDVNITADSVKEFDAYVVTAGAAGTVAVAVSLAVLVTGGKMTDEAADAFDPSKDGVDVQGCVDGGISVSAFDPDGMDTATGDRLAGSGQNAEDNGVSGEDFGQNGEGNLNEQKEDDNINTAQGAGDDGDAYVNNEPLTPEILKADATSARIETGAQITSAQNIYVEAQDTISLCMITGAIAASGIASVGVGVSVAVLFSNVTAEVMEEAVLRAAGDIQINARALSAKVAANEKKEGRGDTLMSSASTDDNVDAETFNPDNYDIVIVTASVGGALVGVAVSVSAISMYTTVSAELKGDVMQAQSLSVGAWSEYNRVLAVTLGISGGLVAVSGSIALVLYKADITANISEGAYIDITGTISVNTVSNTTAMAIATAMGVGGVAVNVGTAIAINRTNIDTFIGKDVIIADSSAVDVSSQVIAEARALMISLSIGGVGVGATVTIAVLKPTVQTYIGIRPEGDSLEATASQNGSVTSSGNVTVSNDLMGNALAGGISVAAGAYAANGAVVLAFNNIAGYAAVNGSDINCANLNVTGLLSGDAKASATAAAAGFVTAGLLVVYADISAKNIAMIDYTNSTITASGSIGVHAGTEAEPYTSLAQAQIKLGTIGGITININIALAYNRSENTAEIISTSGGSISADEIHIKAYGETDAKVIITGLLDDGENFATGIDNVSAVSITVTVGIANLNSAQYAQFAASGTVSAGVIEVISYQNYDDTSDDYNAETRIASGGGALISVSGYIGIAKANATGIASFGGGTVGASASAVLPVITIKSYGESNAKVDIGKMSLDVIAAGVMYGDAQAQGTFTAQLGGTAGTITADKITVMTVYSADAICDVNPAEGGFTASYCTTEVNLANAKVTTNATACVINAGDISVQKNMTVKVTGNVKAYAIVHTAVVSASGISIAANSAIAELTALQQAYIDTSDINLNGYNLNVISEYNLDTAYFAEAIVGTAGSGGPAATFSYASAEGNGAEADSNSTNRAYINNSSITNANVITVKSDSVSKAYADIDSASFSLSVYNIEVSVTIAKARGTYEAYIILPAGMAIDAQSIAVSVLYSTSAEATTGTQGSVSMSLIDIGYNHAQSFAQSTASSYIEAGGTITTAEGISVLADGSAYATADIATETVSISAAKIVVSRTTAEASSTQDAYINLLSGAQVTTGGSVNVASEFSDYVSAAVGSVGKDGFSLSLASLTVNIAKATSRADIASCITGSGSLTAADVTVLANTDTNVFTEAVEISGATLISIGDLEVTATASDTVLASIGGIITTTAGNIEVTAEGYAYVSGKCESGTNLSLVGISVIDAEAYLGKSNIKHKVTAEVEENAILTSAADIIIYAFNEGDVYVMTKNGFDLSGIEVSPFSLDAYSYCVTKAIIGNSAQLYAAGNISIKSEDEISQDTAIAASTSVGIIYSGGTSSVDNYLNQSVETSVKNSVIITAGGNIDILSYSTADMYGSVHLDRAGLISDGQLEVLNTLVRSTTTEVLANSIITSKLGNITISAEAGTDDYLSAQADGESSGFVGVGEVEAECNVSSEVYTRVHAGVIITSTFYTIEISAYNSAGTIYVCGDYGASGLGASPEAYADSINTTNNATVSIGGTGSLAVITARNIDIFAKVPFMDISTYTNAVTTGFAGTAYATSKVVLNINDTISITNTELRAYDALNIASSTDPMNYGTNISAIANTKITAFCGHIESTAMVTGIAQSSVAIGNVVTVYGADVYINAKKFDGNVSLSATGTRHAIASKDCTETYSVINLNTVSIAPAEAGGIDNVIFIIGDGSAGIVVYIDESGAVHQVGLPDEVIAAIRDNTEMTINITTSLSNNEPGRLRIYNCADTVKVYHQDFVPYINVINESAYSLLLGRMDTFNEVYSSSTVNSGQNYYFAPTMINTNPEINITSYQNTDVSLGGEAGTIGLVSTVINEKGALNISWADGVTGNLYNRKVTFNNGAETVPCVWTHELNISGALNIGTASERFAMFMAIKDGASPVINIDATGDVYLELTLADINLSDNIDGIVEDTSPLPNSDFLLSHIASTGIVDIYLPVALRMNYLEGASGINIVFPGIVVYTDETINLSAGTITDIERYRQQFAEDDYRYILPNGTTIYTDADGVIMKIVTPAGSCTLENYQYYTNASGQLIVSLLDKGIKINLATGRLTFEGISDKVANETFELYLEFLSTIPAFNEDDAEEYWAVDDSYDVSIVDVLSLVKVEDNSIIEYDFDTIAKEIFKERNGNTYYIVWVNKDTVDGSVYNPGIDDYQIIVVDSNGYLVAAYDAERVEGTLDQSDWDQKTITLYSLGIYNHKYTLLVNGVEVVVEGHFTSAGGVLVPGTDRLVSIGGSTNLVLGTDGYYYASNASSVRAESLMVKVDIESTLKSGNMQFDLDYSYIGNLEELELKIKSETIDNGDDDYEIRYTYYDMKEYDLAFDSKFAVDINGIIHEIDVDGFFSQTVGDLTIAQIRGGIIYLEENSSNAVSSLLLERITHQDMQGNTITGYRLTEDLFIGIDGTIYFGYSVVPYGTEYAVTYTGTYNGAQKTYEDDYLNISEAALPFTGYIDIDNAEVIVKAGSMHYERLSDTIARDYKNNYYYYNGTAWVSAAVTVSGGVTQISYGGEVKFEIETVGGVTYYHDVVNMIKLGSDGTVEFTGFNEGDNYIEILRLTATAAANYYIGEIFGSTVVIKMDDPNGSILDDNYPTGTDDNDLPTPSIDITATERVVFMAQSTGSIGTLDNRIDIVSPIIDYLNLAGEDVISTNTYIEILGSSEINDGQPIVIDHAEFNVTGEGGDIYYGTIEVEGDGTATEPLLKLVVTGGRILPTNMHPDPAMSALNGAITLIGADALLSSDMDIVINHFSATDGSFEIISGGDVLAYTNNTDALADAYIYLDNAECSITATGSIEHRVITLDNASTYTSSAGGDFTAIDETSGIWAADSTVDITAQGSGVYHTIVLDNSSYTSFVKGSYSPYNELSGIWAEGSAIDIMAGLDITYNVVRVQDTGLAMRTTGGNIFALNGDSFVKVEGTLSTLVMSALYDIAKQDMHMLADIEEGVTFNIEHVEDYWIDSVYIPIPVLALAPVYGGIDENGVEIIDTGFNEYISNVSLEILTTDYADIALETWAQLVADAMTRAEWLAISTAGSIEELIENEIIGYEILSEYLEDETITEELVAQKLEALQTLAPGDAEYDDAKLWLADMESRLRQAIIDKENPIAVPGTEPFIITDEMAADILEMIIDGSYLMTIDDGRSVITEDMYAEFMTVVTDRIKELLLTETDPDSTDAKDIEIYIDRCVGTAYVTNQGSITITQELGDMVLYLIDSAREDVTLTNNGGRIISAHGDDTTVIEAENISLYALNSIGTLTQALMTEQMTNDAVLVANILDDYLDIICNIITPDDPATEIDETIKELIGTLTSEIRFDWIRAYDEYAEGSITATSVTGSVYLEEATGAMGLANISAGADVRLAAQSVDDVRDAADLSNIITAGGSLEITVDEGGIGTVDDYFNTSVGGSITIIAPEDIFITDTLDMNMTVTTLGNVNAEAESGLTLANTSGDLLLGYIQAGGIADITSMGSITEGDRHGHDATVKAEGITLTANGIIGTYENPFDTDIGAGDFNAFSTQLILNEISGGININQIVSTGDVQMNIPGAVTSNDSTAFADAANLSMLAGIADAEADEAETTAAVLQAYADRVREPADTADQNLADAQAALDDANAHKADLEAQLATETDPDEIQRLQDEIDALDIEIAELEAERDAMQAEANRVHALLDADILRTQTEADAARLNAEALRLIADNLQAQADLAKQAAQASPSSITADGNFRLTAGGSVGTDTNPLSIEVPGTIYVKSGGDVTLGSNSAMSIKRVTGGDVSLTTTQGMVTEAIGSSYPSITAQNLGIFALGRDDVGKLSNYIDVWTTGLSAIGVNIYINNLNKTVVGLLDAQNDMFLNSGGAVTAGAGAGIIKGDDIILISGGGVGAPGAPIIIDGNSLYLTSKGDVVLKSVSPYLRIGRIVGKAVTIEVTGAIGGGVIYARDLIIAAQGSIGAPLDKLVIRVSHLINLSSLYGGVYYINIYPFFDKWMERQLLPYYQAVYAVSLKYFDFSLNSLQTFCVLIGFTEEGRWDVLGFYILITSDDYSAMFADIAGRGVEEIDIMFTDGDAAMTEALAGAFSGTAVCTSTYLWVLNNTQKSEVDAQYRQMLEELREIYCALTVDEAEALYSEFISKWQSVYPDITAHLEGSWQGYMDNFMLAAGFDFEYVGEMTEAMRNRIQNARGFADGKALTEIMFNIMIPYFPYYTTERVVS